MSRDMTSEEAAQIKLLTRRLLHGIGALGRNLAKLETLIAKTSAQEAAAKRKETS